MNNNVSKIWEEYAPLYFKFTPNLQEDLLKNVASVCNGKVLDGGCGVGKLVSRLDFNDVSSYWGIDSNIYMLDLGKKSHNSYKNVFFNSGNVESLNFENNFFDTVVSTNVLYSVNSPQKLISEAYRVLKYGGILDIASPNYNIDIDFLAKKSNEELISKYGEDSISEIERYINLNSQLSGKSDFKPHIFSIDEISDLLKLANFKIEEKKEAYLGHLFHITASKL